LPIPPSEDRQSEMEKDTLGGQTIYPVNLKSQSTNDNDAGDTKYRLIEQRTPKVYM
jgi:hypothetical protein